MRTLFFLASVFLTCQNVEACECLPVSFEQEVQTSTSIFYGRVTQAAHHIFDIQILKMWKGDPHIKVYRLEQNASCSRRVFELNKEYIFYVNGNEVSNCSRTEEADINIDDELLDATFEIAGDKKKVLESNELTARQRVVLKNILVRHKIVHPAEVADGKLTFAVGDEITNKRMFFENARWHGPHMRVEPLAGSGNYLLWIGFDWKKSYRRLRRQL